MKHVFVVHSHITYLITVAIIKELKLKDDEIVILSFNNSFSPEINPYPINYLYNRNNSLLDRLLNFFRHFHLTKHIDEKIDLLTSGDNFKLYINYAYGLAKILMTHSKCVGFAFIEEGMDNYKNENLSSFTVHAKTSSFRCGLKKRFLWGIYFWKDIFREITNKKLNLLPVHPSCYLTLAHVEYFTFSPFAFPNIPSNRKFVLKIDALADVYNNNETTVYDNSAIWIGDNIVNTYGVDVGKYISAINAGITEIKSRIIFDKFYVKFHHNESTKSKSETLALFTSLGMKPIVIESAQSIELILLKAKNVKVIGLSSSLLWYASCLEHKSYSINRFLNVNHIPKDNIYWQAVQLI